MRKINLLALALVVLTLVFPKSVLASNVSITQLPGYINYTDFKLGCSALGGTSAQFSSKKDGVVYTNFGPVIDLTTSTCQVQVSGLQFGSEGKFFFKVTLNDGTSAETSVTLDTTATGSVTDFGKERINSGTTYKLHWRNPLESDFVKVFVYRGTEPGFNADDSHKVAEIGGNPGDTQDFSDNGLDVSKEYYYAYRALDRANNSSALVGDSGTTITQSTSGGSVLGSSNGSSGRVTQLPSEGSVLGDGSDPISSPESASTKQGSVLDNNGLFGWILTHKKISLGIILALAVAVYLLKRFRKK